MAKAKDWRGVHRCPTTPKGAIKVQRARTGTCFVVERVQRNGAKGFITMLHNRATGRRTGYSGATRPGKACPLTQDPFRAEIRPKSAAVSAGAACARKFSVAKKMVQHKKRKPPAKRKSRRR